MKADELWEKYGNEVLFGADMQVSEDAFRAALKEYGEHVKSEAVKVCSSEFPSNWCDPLLTGNDKVLKMDGSCQDIERYTTALKTRCAAAIEKMPLP